MATERKYTHDLGELAAVAIEALTAAMSDGEQLYEPGHWIDTSMSEHIDHIDEHLDRITKGDVDVDHYTHLIARAVILYRLYQKEIEKAD